MVNSFKLAATGLNTGLVRSSSEAKDGGSQRHWKIGTRSPVTPWNRNKAMTKRMRPSTPPNTPSRTRHRNLDRKRHQRRSRNKVKTPMMAVAMFRSWRCRP